MSHRLNSYFNASQQLRQLFSKAEQLRALQQRYEQVAPATLVRFSHVMLLEQQTLTLIADNSAVAAKLRQLAPRLVQQLQESGREVTAIQVRVQVALPPASLTTPPPALSSTGQKRLLDSTEKLPDSLLKKVLLRLAKKK